MHIDSKWVECPHAYSHKMGERVKMYCAHVIFKSNTANCNVMIVTTTFCMNPQYHLHNTHTDLSIPSLAMAVPQK